MKDQIHDCFQQNLMCGSLELRLRWFRGCGHRRRSDRIDQQPERDKGQQTPGHLSQKLRDDLTKAGFTNITIMPSSFLVRAKDLEGNPMMMVINPDSVTEVTAQAPAASSAMKAQPNSQSSASTPNQNSATTPKK